MSLSDLAVELLNEAKLSIDIKEKLYKLEQVKEITLHRDLSLLSQLMDDITSFRIEKSLSIRKFILKFIEEVCIKIPKEYISLIQICSYFFADEVFTSNININNSSAQHESIHKYIGSVLMKLHGDICIYIMKLPTTTTTVSNDSRIIWQEYQELCTKIIDSVSIISLPDSTKSQFLRFIEEYILFGLPPPLNIPTNDPRKIKVIKKNSVADIPFHHPFMNPKLIEQDAEALLNKCLLWVSKNGPQGLAFSPNVLSQLISSISIISSQRPNKLSFASKAILLFLKDKLPVFQSMSSESKDLLMSSCTRLIQSLQTSTDLADMAIKIRAELDAFESIMRDKSDESTLLRKRPSQDISTASSMDADDIAGDIRVLAKEAVDAAATERKSSRQTLSAASTASASSSYTADFELCADLAPIPPIASKDKLISVAFQADGAYVKSDAVVTAIPKPPSVHDDLSMCSLRRVLDGYFSPAVYHPEAQPSIARVTVRTVLLMAYTDVQAERTQSIVKVVSSNQPSVLAEFPYEVALPRSLWLFLSYCIQRVEIERTTNEKKSSNKRVEADAATLLIALFSELHERCRHLSDAPDLALYSAALLVTLSRCIEKKTLRPLIKQTLLSVPIVPQSCLYLISIIALRSNDHLSNEKNNLKDMLSLLCDVTREAQSRWSREVSLQTLLWFSVSDDFDVRIKTISYLAKDLLDKNEGITRSILSFAMHAAIHTVGVESIADKDKEFPSTKHSTVADGVMNTAKVSQVDSLFESAERFDYGKSFGGSFTLLSGPESSEKIRDHNRRHIHLLSQIILTHPELFFVLVELFSVSEYIIQRDTNSSESNTDRAKIMKEIIISEISTIIPVLQQNISAEEIFDIAICSDIHAKDLVLEVLASLYKDDRIPPTGAVINKVRRYAQQYDESYQRKALIPIIGGLPTEEVERLLSGYVKAYGSAEGQIELERIFGRIYKARPPPLSKAALLIALHRIDIEKQDQKAVLDSIELCLRNKNEFKIETIKEAVGKLLEDEIPVLPLMRTAIRAAQSFSEMRNYVLNEVVPKMILKEVWVSSPRVWEGVLLSAKILIEQKDGEFSSKANELMVKAVLGLPLKQLSTMLSTTPKLKHPFSIYCAELSAFERDIYLLGQQTFTQEDKREAMIKEKIRILAI